MAGEELFMIHTPKERWSCHDHQKTGPGDSESPFRLKLMTRGTSLVDVVIDPDLSSLMRAHQKEGVKVSRLLRAA